MIIICRHFPKTKRKNHFRVVILKLKEANGQRRELRINLVSSGQTE